MPKGIMVVQSGPVDSSREDDYNEWYSHTHIPEVCSIEGFVSARRFKLHGNDGSAPHSYVAIYEIDAEDLDAPAKELGARAAAGQSTASDAMQLDPPPIITFYEAID